MDGSTSWPSRSAGDVQMTQANGFVVVSWWRNADASVPPYKGSYEYEHVDTLKQAERLHQEYEEGEHKRATARGIFAAKDGMPVGGRVL